MYFFEPQNLRRIAAALIVSLSSVAGGVEVAAAAEERPLVLVPGVLGSKLCRTDADGNKTLLWGNAEAILQFPDLAIGDNTLEVEPCGLIEEVSFLGVFTQDVYGPFIDRLDRAGYRQDSTLLIFDYDWRLSVFDNARLLAAFIDENTERDSTVDIVAHSMGGLIARTYALEEGGDTRIHRLITAGTPWRGSVKVFGLLENGWGVSNLLMGGLEAVRRTVLSFPSMYELMPSYEGCCRIGDAPGNAFDAGNMDAWADLGWEGVDEEALPELADVAERQSKLRRIVDTPLPAAIEEVLIIGVDQRTPEQYELQVRRGEAHFDMRTSWEGDGTVLRESAQLQKRVTYPTSFAVHNAILNDELVQDFAISVLREGSEVAHETVPVRKRTSVLTALGAAVELVGVVVTTDQPVYETNATATATVHLRLEVQDPVDAGRFSLALAASGTTARPIVLHPDPGASDPTNPFEQSFSARFETGPEAGKLVLTLTVEGETGAPRVIVRTVPVL
ncbi:alpha/beta fold hydrolase [Labrenzia sp. OB1]|uniref:esterase/lipase family protein n=1 Tax=Labrenzia sp. OB1 TaxID=1561204 RepID=UPI0007B27CED|nr:alpha/beta fold hydrolase [Labrenzia sp. OB1]KZM49191.1 hypothetical protein OA90_15590 [Labrenzia sp. OB1]